MSLSGGMDSTALMMKLISDGFVIRCITFEYGQKHNIEIDRAKRNIEYLSDNGIIVEHMVIDISAAMKSINSSLIDDDAEIPEGHYESEQMKLTVVPNRNAIFSSILYGHALSISSKEDCDVSIALGVHSGDHEIYPDCRPEFYESLSQSFTLGNWGSERVSFLLPYINGDKETILSDAMTSIASLNLDFDIIFGNTITSYNPDSLGRSSGRSGSDVERILAFNNLGIVDPIEYVEEWDIVVKRALLTKEEYEATR